MQMDIIYRSIGIIHSSFDNLEGMPIQPTSDISGSGTVEIFPQFLDGVKDLEGFSHIYLIYHFHKMHHSELNVTPFLDKCLDWRHGESLQHAHLAVQIRLVYP